MKKLSSCLLYTSALFAASSLHATIIASTSFGGSAASPSGNTGFSSSIFASTAGGGTPSAATFTSGDMSGLPTAYVNSGFVNSGNYISTGSGGGGAQPTFLTLSSGIDVGSASTTYFSFLYNVTTTAGQGGGVSFFSGATELVQIGTGGTAPNGNGTIRIAPVGGSQSNSANGSYVSGAGNTVWIVGKIETTTGADTISINIYQGSTPRLVTEGAWDLTNSFNYSSIINTIRFNSPNIQEFDEFRMGTTYADVAGAIPEPSAFAALAGVGGLGFAMLRRRRDAR